MGNQGRGKSGRGTPKTNCGLSPSVDTEEFEEFRGEGGLGVGGEAPGNPGCSWVKFADSRLREMN